MSARVVTLDLRGRDADEAVRKVGEHLREQRDLSLLLVEDTAAEVVAHRAAFEALDKSHQVGRLLCVVVGRQQEPGDEGRPADGVRLPGNIRQRTLWVIEPAGVDWPLRAAAHAKPRDDREADGLGRLAALLRLPDLFIATHAALAEVPFGVAVPGLHIAGISSTGQEEFLQALHAAIKRLLEDPMAAAPASRAEPARRTGRVAPRLVENGPIQRAFDEVERAITEAREVTGELPGVRSLVEELPVEGPVVETGDRLAELRALFSELLLLVPGDGRITPDRLDGMTAQGIQPPPIEEFDEKAGRTRLIDWLRECLKRGSSLPRIAEGLQEWARELEQHAGNKKALARICSNSLLYQLRHPRPLPPLQGWLPVPGAVCAALAGLSPVGIVSGLVMALLWTSLVALTVIRGPGGRIQDHSRMLAVNALGAVAGAIGGGLGGASGLPDIVSAVAVLCAVTGAMGTVLYSWRRRAEQWVAECGLDVAERAVEELKGLLGQMVTDWAGANERLGMADAVNRVRQAFTGVRDALDTNYRRMDDELRELPQRPQPLAGYGDMVQRWVGDLVPAALRPVFAGLTDGDPHNYRQVARDRALELIREWESEVERGGVADPPSFAAADQPADVAATTRDDLALMVREAAYDPAAEMWQLCAPTDLGLLNAGSPPRTVRFAPRAAAGGEGGLSLPPNTLLVSSVGHCGVLRLVPLNPKVVEWTWTEDGGYEGDATGPPPAAPGPAAPGPADPGPADPGPEGTRPAPAAAVVEMDLDGGER